MRIIFMGNPEFSIPVLQKIIESKHHLLAVVSNPPKKMGRGNLYKYTPIGDFSRKNDLLLIHPDELDSNLFQDKIRALKPDLFIVVAYKILPISLINIPNYGALNLHASLLPKYRGAAPIQWALMNGEKTTGITIFQIKPDVDTGDILYQKEYTINENDNMYSLGMRLCVSGSKYIVKTIDEIHKGKIIAVPQDSNKATSAPKITKKMATINWSWSAQKIHNWVRGLSPFPGMVTKYKNKNLRIFKTKLYPGLATNIGEIYLINKKELIISTGNGLLSLLEVQLEGKKRMDIQNFLNGNLLVQGERLI